MKSSVKSSAAIRHGHSAATVISMAVLASATATLLHEGVGHGVTAWLTGAVPTELTSNHLSTLHENRWVDAGGTLANLFAGTVCLLVSRAVHQHANLRYFLWLLAALNLLAGAGYFLFSGVLGLGDWEQVITGLPRQGMMRLCMTIFGAALYFAAARCLAVALKPFCPDRRMYNVLGRLPYVAACAFSCVAGLLDPLGLKLLFLSTVPAALGGSSGLLWADNLLPRNPAPERFVVRRQPALWIAAVVAGCAYIAILGPGIRFRH